MAITEFKSAPAVIIFDWDNTLVDSWGTIHQSWNATLEHMGLPLWSMQQTKDNVAKSLRDTFPELFGERWTEARDVFYKNFEALHLQYLAELPGVTNGLEQLAQAPCKLAIVSNKTGYLLRKEVEQIGWSHMFSAVVGAQDAAYDKPHQAPVDMVLQQCGFLPERDQNHTDKDNIWFVGDNAIDIQCGKQSGCKTVLLHKDPLDTNAFGQWHPDILLPDFDAFINFWANITERILK